MMCGNCVWCVLLQVDGFVSKVGQFFMLYGLSGLDGLMIDMVGWLFVVNFGFGCVWVLNYCVEFDLILISLEGVLFMNLCFGGFEMKMLFMIELVFGMVFKIEMDIVGLQLYWGQQIKVMFQLQIIDI